MKTSRFSFAGTLGLIALTAAAAMAAPRPAPPAEQPAAKPAPTPADKPTAKPGEDVSQMPALPITPAEVRGLLYARPFTLDQGYETEWRADHPLVKSGWLVVLEVDPACVFPRQAAEPVLYVGQSTAERINQGEKSGRVIAIVPSEVDAHGDMVLDLAGALMWFGTPMLPEQVDAAKVQAERQKALAAKVSPRPAQEVEQARTKAGKESLKAADRTSLRHAAAELMKTWSPDEAELADIISAE